MKDKGPIRVGREGSVVVLTIDNPPVNALSRVVRTALLRELRTIRQDRSVTGLVIRGGKGRFIGGADLKEMDREPEPPHLPDIIDELDALEQTIVVAIDGPALGGGLEVALAADHRLAGPSAILGLTETRLGIVPGAGGTQRLTRLVGVAAAISLMANGTILSAQQAADKGVIDQVVPGDLLEEALQLAQSGAKRRISMLSVPADDPAAIAAAAKAATSKARGNPAIGEVVRLAEAARDLPFRHALVLERETFLRLRHSPEARAFRHLFFAERAAGKPDRRTGTAPRPIQRVVVIGGGTMGSGIAASIADAGLQVAIVERDAAACASAEARLRDIYDRQMRSGRLSSEQAATRREAISLGADWQVAAQADLVIEAAFEDMQVKTDVFRRLDALVPAGALLATNTSYLDVDAIGSATTRPQDVLGLHFFSPAHVMKLLEIVEGRLTSAEALASALALAKRIGKLPVLARNAEGFIGNRIYSAYRRHAEYLVEDGAAPDEVDAALESFGFAMGVFAVSDLSGLDISQAMRRRRAASRDPGERYVRIADMLCDAGRLGRKSGLGWYRYDPAGKRSPDPVVAEMINRERRERGVDPRRFNPEEVQRRLLAVMVNEGAKVIAEGVARSPDDIDVVLVNGYGFPRHRGGPLWSADQIGLGEILNEVIRAHSIGGTGSEPAALLVELAGSGGRFADLAASPS